ncbi:MAG TPA: lasso RiPP family leader peptide-containing protein [Nocardioides sp.]|nr:lasso RiPP family leader peptide-containing protein [Nocardioides sp.]
MSRERKGGVTVHEHYEPPKLTAIGSVRGLTMGEGIFGHDDSFVFHWGPITIGFDYGHGS